MTTNLDIIRATYEGSSEENGKNLLSVLAPDAAWTEAAGFPYAGTYVGPGQIISGVSQRLGTEWDGYNAKVHTYPADGDRVAAFGGYSGTYRKPLDGSTRADLQATGAPCLQAGHGRADRYPEPSQS
ncbi:nuclear transport factor 2 family protein [Paraburkholderia kururiensis]|uniref:nuclear transport factor 2 family protein n=1 Tax=Paraburkholderia kururiensis TaxID=984307 RepID=UPI0009DE531A|nr:nuclear transport factor 2 family protein [Paraburkholderia kururiensis]